MSLSLFEAGFKAWDVSMKELGTYPNAMQRADGHSLSLLSFSEWAVKDLRASPSLK
jgi:hypothetical protein